MGREAPKRSRQRIDRSPAHLPDLARGGPSIAVRKVPEIDIRLLHQQGGARGCAAPAEPGGLEQDHAGPACRQAPRRRATGDAAPDDYDIRMLSAVKRNRTRHVTAVTVDPQAGAAPKSRHLLIPREPALARVLLRGPDLEARQ